LLNVIDNYIISWFQIDRSTNTNIGIGKSEDPKQTSGGKSTKGLCCLFLFIMYFVHDTILDIGKSEENEAGNEEGLTSGGKSTEVPVAGQNKRTEQTNKQISIVPHTTRTIRRSIRKAHNY